MSKTKLNLKRDSIYRSEIHSKKLFDSQSVVLQTVADIISKQRVAFVFVEGVAKKSESWDIYIDDRIIQSVKGRNPECVFS